MKKSEKEITTVFFTLVAKNYISYARTLCESIAEHHPDAKIYIGLSDMLAGGLDPDKESFEIIEADKLELPSFDAFAFRYDVMEFSTAIKPYMFRWIFNNTNAQKVIYLDPDILVTSPLVQVMDMLDQGASAVLTPHLISRVDDSYLPNENTMLQVGVYNLGFIGLSRQEEAHRLVAWWCDRLEKEAIVDLANGLFTDQKWADLMPCLFGGVAILRDPGYNAAYWNLMHRQICNVSGKWMANDKALAFFHFSGVDPNNPISFSKHQNRYTMNDIGELKILYEYYLDRLKVNGYFDTKGLPYAFNYLDDGTKIESAMRTYFRKFLDSKGTRISEKPFSLRQSYFNEPEQSFGINSPVTRFMFGLLQHQAALQKAFDLQTLDGQYAYTSWFVRFAPSIYSVENSFIEPAQAKLERWGATSGFIANLRNKIYTWGYYFHLNYPGITRLLLQIMPAKMRMRFRSSARQVLTSPMAGRQSEPGGSKKNPEKKITGSKEKVVIKNSHGITLVGYVEGEFGVAENLRSVGGSLQQVNYPIDIYEIDAGSAYRKSKNRFSSLVTEESTNRIQLYCVNADQLRHTQEKLGANKVSGAYRIGYWFWELSRFPEAWHHAFDLVDEVWAPTQYVYDTLSKVSNKPVIHIPVAVDFTIQGQYSRESFGLAESNFLFLFSYDFNSFSQRKNPQACIEAFQKAFPVSKPDVGLVIKTIYGEEHPDAYIKLLELALTDRRIKVINRTMSRDEMYGLINVCDSYISLHRAEGFGLGIAEAMNLGKPVITTGYSGNMDFTNHENSCLVDYKLVPVPSDAYPHWAGQVWAEPDINQAAGYMSKIYEDKSFREHISQNGQDLIKREHSFAAVGACMLKRLKALEGELV